MPIYVCIYIYIEIRDSHLPDRKKTCPLCGTPPYLDSFVFGRPSRHQKKNDEVGIYGDFDGDGNRST